MSKTLPTPKNDISPIDDSIQIKEDNYTEINENVNYLEKLFSFMDICDDIKNTQKSIYESIKLSNLSNNVKKRKVFQTQIETTKHNHGLVYLLSNKNWFCNNCGKYNSDKEPTNYCSLCDFYICNKCIGRQKKYPLKQSSHEQTKLKLINFPFHQHKLIYCRTSRFEDKLSNWNCDLCEKTYSNKIWSFYCTICDYDVCLKCSKNYIPKKELIYNNGIKIDEHEHPLVFMKTNRNFICYLCLNSYKKSEPTYYCTKCEFHICQKCKENLNDEPKKLFYGKEINLNDNIESIKKDCHKHPLIYCITSISEKNTYWTCNLCLENYGKEYWYFYCSICDYYLCYNCYSNFY